MTPNIINVNGGTIIGSVIGSGNVYNSEFKKASSLIGDHPSLDAQTVERLRDFLLKAEEAIKKNDESQKDDVKRNFRQFLDNLGDKTKIVLPILAQCASVLTFFGLKP